MSHQQQQQQQQQLYIMDPVNWWGPILSLCNSSKTTDYYLISVGRIPLQIQSGQVTTSRELSEAFEDQF